MSDSAVPGRSLLAKRLAQFAVDSACAMLGRRQMVRAARFALNRSRLDLPNAISTNGESALQEWVLAMDDVDTPVEVIDIGANRGLWSLSLLAAAKRARKSAVVVHACEPSSYTCGLLREALKGEPAVINQLALSDAVGEAVMSVVAPGAGTNSLHPAMKSSETEIVKTTTLDAFTSDRGMTHIRLIKIDTEGHDFQVLQGARGLFVKQLVDVVQFEYNHRWIYARAFLKDVFELLSTTQYHIGKLTPHGIEFYSRWEPDLETFVEGNYVICTASLLDRLPRIPWWKDERPGWQARRNT